MKAPYREDKPTISLQDRGIAVLRVVVGFTFLMHGWQKVSMGIPTVVRGFEMMGVPLPTLTGPLVAVLELVGGALLLLGLGTRWVAIPLAVDMLAASLLVHLPKGFFAPDGVELTLLLLASTVALALTGAGAFALDHVISRARAGALGSPTSAAARVDSWPGCQWSIKR